jgi:hypothetical protein
MLKSPKEIETGVSRSAKYHSLMEGTFAQISAKTVAAMSQKLAVEYFLNRLRNV